MKRMAGTSLVEVLICVAVFMILCSIALPKEKITDKHVLDFATDELATDLHWMQQLSLNTLQGKANSPQVMPEILPAIYFQNGNPSGYKIQQGTKILKSVTFSKQIQITSNAPYSNISFNYHGHITPTFKITLQYQGQLRYIIVDCVGRIRTE